jgi:prefoldin subunit 5
MSNIIDFSNGAVEMRDGQGRTVRVVLADKVADALTAEIERLKAEMARLQNVVAERDQTIHSLHALLEEVAGFRPEELEDLEKNGASLDRVIEELESLKSR